MNNYRIESDCVTQFAQEYAINVSFINYHGTVEMVTVSTNKNYVSKEVRET